jgi:superfamily II DNA or RNA helicase
MREVSCKVQGLACTFAKGTLESDLTARTEVKVRIRGGKDSGRFKTEISYDPCYYENEDGTITCGLGALLFLTKNNPFCTIEFNSIDPPRSIFARIEIPKSILESSKWLVNGKKRWYIEEAAEACRKHHNGTVKLPTGSSKTILQLIIAYSLLMEKNTTLILVPSYPIYSQFLGSARMYDIPMVDYRERVAGSNQEPMILLSTPGVVYNDIISSKYKEQFKLISTIIADECHHVSAHTWHTIFMALPNVTRSYGFSAMPMDYSVNNAMNFSGMDIESALIISAMGPIIYEKSARELKDFLNIPKLINLHYTWPKDKWAEQRTDDWHKLRQLQYKNIDRLNLIATVIRLLIDRQYNTIIHVSEKELGIDLLRLVDSDKCVAWYGGGKVIDKSNNRYSAEWLRKEAGNSILGIIGTQHLIEGMDLESPLNAIVLWDGKNARQVLQKSGRITRPGKKSSVIVNLVDSGLWILPRHSEERRQVTIREFDPESYEVTSLAKLKTTLGLIERASL